MKRNAESSSMPSEREERKHIRRDESSSNQTSLDGFEFYIATRLIILRMRVMKKIGK